MEELKNVFLNHPVDHIDIKTFDTREIIRSKRNMSFVAREMAIATEIYQEMVEDNKCSIILTIAGSATAAGCLHIPIDMIENNMVDAIVLTGAAAVDMDFFEGLGFRHYQGSQFVDDEQLRELAIDRIYDTYINEDDLKICDHTICDIADQLPPRPYSSQEFLAEMGKYLIEKKAPGRSMLKSAYLKGVPLFSPAFTDSSAGFGLVMHQAKRQKEGKPYVTIDSIKDFYDLTKVVVKANQKEGYTGLFMIGGGSPKNFAQDTIVCAEALGYDVNMHKLAVQITVADSRDGACSSSTLKEANSWGKVRGREQMVFAEATTVWPEIISATYQQIQWKILNRESTKRMEKNYLKFLNDGGLI